jgi:hypothetical protein
MSRKDRLEYLEELLEPTPSAAEKLLAAWDGLHTETQIQVLLLLQEKRGFYSLGERLRKKALDSPNAYVRYLAVKDLVVLDDDRVGLKELQKRIERDPHPLVKYSALETELSLGLAGPDEFFALPQPARLATVRCLVHGGEKVAGLVEAGVERGVPEGELSEILADYLKRDEWKESYAPQKYDYDGFGQCSAGKDIKALWHLALKVPEDPCSYILIKNLPESAGLGRGIPTEVIDGFSERQLGWLLERVDIGLNELRKKLLLGDNDDLSYAAACGVHIDYETFGQVLAQPDEKKFAVLSVLGYGGHHLPLCVLEAISDAQWATEFGRDRVAGSPREDSTFPKLGFDRRLKKLEGEQRQIELRELGLYRIARRAMPWNEGEDGYPPSGEFEFLAEEIQPGDTWATFIRMSRAWSRHPHQRRPNRGLLEFGEGEADPFESEPDGEDDEGIDLEGVERRLSEKLTALRDELREAGVLTRRDSWDSEDGSKLQQQLRGLRDEIARTRKSVRTAVEWGVLLILVGLLLVLVVR